MPNEPEKRCNDHIHVTVADDDDINHVTRLDIWQNSSTISKTLETEIKDAHAFVIFQHDKNKKQIIEEWINLYGKIAPHRNLYHRNCAYSSRRILTKILKINLYPGIVPARSALFVWQPYLQIGVPLPGAILKKLSKALKKEGVSFYDKRKLSQLRSKMQ